MRKEIELTKDELSELHKAASTPGVFTGGILAGYSPARAASEEVWRRVAEKHGVKWGTIRPVSGKGSEWVSAESNDE